MGRNEAGIAAVATGETAAITRALDRADPGVRFRESFVVAGAAEPALIAALRERVCPGALLRATPGGWALDWPSARGAGPLWQDRVRAAARGPGPQFPTDEQAAACLRLADGVALALGLGRGHVFPVFENPARRAVDMQAFCDLPSLAPGLVQERVAAFLDLGVPVAAVLGLRPEGRAAWSGFRPPLRWGRILLVPARDGIRERLPEELRRAADEGFGLLLFRPLEEGVAVSLPDAPDLAALAPVLAALEAAAAPVGLALLVEGGRAGEGIASLAIETVPGGLRLGLPAAGAVRESAALLDGVLAAVAAAGGRILPGRRRLAITCRGPAPGAAIRNLLAASLRHPVLTRLGHLPEVGPWSEARRPDEQPGLAGTALARLLAAAPDWLSDAALAPLLEGTEFGLDDGTLAVAGGGGSRAAQHLIGAAAAVPWTPGPPDLPLPAYALPSVLRADLAALLAALAAAGLALDPAPQIARLEALCPLRFGGAAAGVRLEVRQALLDRQLPGSWAAEALEIRLEGQVAGAAVSVAAGEGDAVPLPLARLGQGLVGRIVLPRAAGHAGPAAGLFPPGALRLALWQAGAGALAVRLAGGAAGPELLPPPEGPAPAAAAPAGLDHPGLVLGA
jgi:hypothetical protein